MAEMLARHPDIARRTAQRWVTSWVKDERIAAAGRGRARRYFPVATPAMSSAAPEGAASDRLSSPVGGERDRAPLARPPAAWGYSDCERDFLEAYRPNETFYLDDAMRRQLHGLGDTGQAKLAAGTYAGAVLDRLSIDLAWASSRLEGNAYSFVEVCELIERGKVAEDKAPTDTQMILNHQAAIELLVNNVGAAAFNRYTLLNIHGTLSENQLSDPADEGRLRQHAVEPGEGASGRQAMRSKFAGVIDAMLEKAARVTDPFEQSFFVMVHLPRLRPFADVNKRTSRLLANLPLIRANLCPLTFVGVTEGDYNRAILVLYETGQVEPLRDFYLLAYERSARNFRTGTVNHADPDPMRLEYRDAIRQAVQDAVKYREDDPSDRVQRSLAGYFANLDSTVPADLQKIVVAELGRLHEGVLARYGLRPAQHTLWRNRWQQNKAS